MIRGEQRRTYRAILLASTRRATSLRFNPPPSAGGSCANFEQLGKRERVATTTCLLLLGLIFPKACSSGTVAYGGAEGIRTPDPLNANLLLVVSMVYFTFKRVLRCLNAICVLCVECLQVMSRYNPCVSYLLAISMTT